MTTWLLLPAGLAAAGVGLLTLALSDWLQAVWASISRQRIYKVLLDKPEEEPPSAEELFDIPPLAPWMALGALAGLTLSLTLFYGPGRLLGALGGLLPLLWKRQRIQAGQRQIQRELVNLVASLRLQLGLVPTPGAALLHVIDENPDGILWQRLRKQRSNIYAQGPIPALKKVAADLSSQELRHLLARVRAAQAGASGLSTALREVAAEMTAELQQELGEQVESAPTRLIIPLLAALLSPLLVLLLSPAVQAFLDTLAGVGPAPLGR